MRKLRQPLRLRTAIVMILIAVLAVVLASWLFISARCLEVKKDAAQPAPAPLLHKSSHAESAFPRDKPAPSRMQ